MASSHAAALSSARGAGTPSAFLADPLRRSSIIGLIAMAGSPAPVASRPARTARLFARSSVEGSIARIARRDGASCPWRRSIPPFRRRRCARSSGFSSPSVVSPWAFRQRTWSARGRGAEIASFEPAPSPARRDISPHYPVPAVIAHARDRAVPRTRSLTAAAPVPPSPRDKRRASSTRRMIATRAASASSGNSPRRRPAGTSRRRSKCSSA